MPLYTGLCLAGMAETLPQLAKLLETLLKWPIAMLCLTRSAAAAPNMANCWSCQVFRAGHPRKILLSSL